MTHPTPPVPTKFDGFKAWVHRLISIKWLPLLMVMPVIVLLTWSWLNTSLEQVTQKPPPVVTGTVEQKTIPGQPQVTPGVTTPIVTTTNQSAEKSADSTKLTTSVSDWTQVTEDFLLKKWLLALFLLGAIVLFLAFISGGISTLKKGGGLFAEKFFRLIVGLAIISVIFIVLFGFDRFSDFLKTMHTQAGTQYDDWKTGKPTILNKVVESIKTPDFLTAHKYQVVVSKRMPDQTLYGIHSNDSFEIVQQDSGCSTYYGPTDRWKVAHGYKPGDENDVPGFNQQTWGSMHEGTNVQIAEPLKSKLDDWFKKNKGDTLEIEFKQVCQ